MFQANHCYFGDVQNPRGQLFLVIKALQQSHRLAVADHCMVRMKIGVVEGCRYHYSLLRDKVQKITLKNSFDLNFVLPRHIVVNPVLEIVIFVTVTDILGSQP